MIDQSDDLLPGKPPPGWAETGGEGEGPRRAQWERTLTQRKNALRGTPRPLRHAGCGNDSEKSMPVIGRV